MKRQILRVVLMVSCLLVPGIILAQEGPYITGIQVQNLGATEASITLLFTWENGVQLEKKQEEKIPANASRTYLGKSLGAPSGFMGSVEVFSDQPVVVIGNVLRSDDGRASGSYNGLSVESPVQDTIDTFRLPIIQRGNSGYNSYIVVQNVGPNRASIRIDYTPDRAGTAATEYLRELLPDASHTFRQDVNASLGPVFIGSATVTNEAGTSTFRNIRVTVGQELNATQPTNQTREPKTILLYNGSPDTAGSPTVLLPLIQANNSRFYTGISVQNVGTTTTDITITFGPNTAPEAGTPRKCPQPQPLQFTGVTAGKSISKIQASYDDPRNFGTHQDPCRYIGSATVTNSANQPLVAIVNQAQLFGPYASTYEGFNPAAAGTTNRAPLVMSRNNGYYSGIQIQNTTNTPTTAIIQFTPNVAPSNLCTNIGRIEVPLPASGSVTVNLENYDPRAVKAGFTSNGCSYVGGATITTTGKVPIVTIINHLSTALLVGDQLLTSNAFRE